LVCERQHLQQLLWGIHGVLLCCCCIIIISSSSSNSITCCCCCCALACTVPLQLLVLLLQLAQQHLGGLHRKVLPLRELQHLCR
jgi:hypothetical protein